MPPLRPRRLQPRHMCTWHVQDSLIHAACFSHLVLRRKFQHPRNSLHISIHILCQHRDTGPARIQPGHAQPLHLRGRFVHHQLPLSGPPHRPRTIHLPVPKHFHDILPLPECRPRPLQHRRRQRPPRHKHTRGSRRKLSPHLHLCPVLLLHRIRH